MVIKDNSNIGFKIFFMIILFAVAIVADLVIFCLISDDDYGLNTFLYDTFYGETEHNGCDVNLKHSLSLNKRYLNIIDLKEEKDEINMLLDDVKALEAVDYNFFIDYDDVDYDYVISSCGVYFAYSDNEEYGFYQGKKIDIKEYKERFNNVVKSTIAKESRPRIYEIEDNDDGGMLEPVYFNEQDVINIRNLWMNEPKIPSNSSFNVSGKYRLVIGSDVILFDNNFGVAVYNGKKIDLSDQIMEILENYI